MKCDPKCRATLLGQTHNKNSHVCASMLFPLLSDKKYDAEDDSHILKDPRIIP